MPKKRGQVDSGRNGGPGHGPLGDKGPKRIRETVRKRHGEGTPIQRLFDEQFDRMQSPEANRAAAEAFAARPEDLGEAAVWGVRADKLAEAYEGQLGCRVSIRVGPGWERLVARLLQDVAKVLESRGERLVAGTIATKYATLRADFMLGNHSSASSTELDALALRYEDLSSGVCERCGAPGKQRELAGWLWVACDEHAR